MLFFDLGFTIEMAKNVKWLYKTNFTRFSLFLPGSVSVAVVSINRIRFWSKPRVCVHVSAQERLFALIDKWLHKFYLSTLLLAPHTHAGFLNRSERLLFI